MNHRKNKGKLAARITLGLLFSVFGLNGFLNFIPQPPHGGAAGAFLGALAATGYMFPLIKGTELVAGLLLLAGRAVPFALTLLAPVVVNILAFHLFLEPASLALPLLTLALGLYVAWTERAVYAPLFNTAEPARTSAAAGGHATSAA
ncbi:MAG TPA: DoxX family protein [Polyangiaceae bacterium]